MNVIRRISAFFRHYVGGLTKRALDDHLFLQAGGLAFSIVICMLPLALVLFAVIGVVLDTPHLLERLSAFLRLAIPYPQYAQAVESFITERIEEFRFYKNVSGPVGVVGLFLAASGLFGSMRTILHRSFRIDPGPWALLSKVRDIGLVFLALVYFLLVAAVMPLGEYLAVVARESTLFGAFEARVLSRSIVRFASLLFLLVAFALMFRYVPQARLPGKVIFVSAVSATVFWAIAQILFGIYIANAVTLQEVYGAYLVFTAAVLWIYAASVAFIMGAEVGRLYKERLEKELSL